LRAAGMTATAKKQVPGRRKEKREPAQ